MRAATILVALVVAAMLIVTFSVSARRAAAPRETHPHRVEFRININQADAAMLSLLPGIGPALAERIVAHRQAHGPFADVNSLTQVNGIGPRTVERLRDYAACGP